MSPSPEVTYTEFTCKLITIRTQKSLEDVTGALEQLFVTIDIKKTTEMTAAGDKQASTSTSRRSPAITNS